MLEFGSDVETNNTLIVMESETCRQFDYNEVDFGVFSKLRN